MTDIVIENLTDISAVARASNITQGWEGDELTIPQWRRLLQAEHSPIYEYQLAITFYDVPYYVHVHNVRHSVGVRHYVRSQRPDSMNPVEYNRGKAPQDAPVHHRMCLNAGSLISIAQDRLCFKAWHVTQDLWWRVRQLLLESRDAYDQEVGKAMMPKCIYRGYCPEPNGCGFICNPLTATSDLSAAYQDHARRLATESANE